MNLFITSDTHFFHNKPFIYESRGFSSVEDMNEAIITRWNETVKSNDIVYHLGDVMLNDNEKGLKCLSKLNGQIYIIRGNHCTDARIKLYNSLNNVSCSGYQYADITKYGKFNFYLSHYPTITSNFDDGKHLQQRIINICGHSHTIDPFVDWDKYNAPIFHCEMDTHNCRPWNIDEIIYMMQSKFSLEGEK